jgi:hypothetical protein
MNVPASTPSRLLLEHRLRSRIAPAKDFYDHFRDRAAGADPSGPDAGPPFGHLLNFFSSSNVQSDTTGGWNTAGPASSNFFRALEFLRVPSRFDGADLILNPQLFTTDGSGERFSLSPHTLHPPFNRLSRYRDPGLININTIGDDGVTWQAILNNDGVDPATGLLRNRLHWRKVFLSRQGYGSTASLNQPPIPMLKNESPTMFANPFRPYSDDYNVPIDALRNSPLVR